MFSSRAIVNMLTTKKVREDGDFFRAGVYGLKSHWRRSLFITASSPSDSLTATSNSLSEDSPSSSAFLALSKLESIESDAMTAVNETPEDQASSSSIKSRKAGERGALRNSGESEKAYEDGAVVEREEGQEEEEDEEEEGECGFCLFMKGGGCKESFIAWEQCIEEAEKSKEDVVEKCFQVTSALKKCMEANADYYEPILRAEKNEEEEAMKQLEEEANDLRQDAADSERTRESVNSDHKASDVNN